MFKVTFSSNSEFDGDCQTVFQSEHIEPSVEFAMALHRSSNVPHTIVVVLHPNILPVEDQICLTLTLKENLKDRK